GVIVRRAGDNRRSRLLIPNRAHGSFLKRDYTRPDRRKRHFPGEICPMRHGRPGAFASRAPVAEATFPGAGERRRTRHPRTIITAFQEVETSTLMKNETSTIQWTLTDEAPALTTYSLLPIVRAFLQGTGIEVESRDISLAGRILANFPDRLSEGQRVPDHLSLLGDLTHDPAAIIIKL